MNIYIIVRKDEWGYDEYDSMIIRARNEDEVRRIADNHAGGPWLDPERASVELVQRYGEAGVILGSFNAG